MMNADALIALRPSNDTSDAARDSLGRVQTAITAAEDLTRNLTAERDKVILTGTITDMKTVNDELEASRSWEAALLNLKNSIVANLPLIERREKADSFRAQVARSDALTSAICERFRQRYPILAEELADLFREEAFATAVRLSCSRDWMNNRELVEEFDIPFPKVVGLLPVGYTKGTYGEIVEHLPGLAPAGEPSSRADVRGYWPVPSQDREPTK